MYQKVFALAVAVSSLVEGLPDRRAVGPSVKIENGTVVGSSAGVVESFKGIPFAQPPVGPLRLKPPQSIDQKYGTIQATGVPRSCPQYFTQVDTGNLPQDVAGMLLDSPLVQEATDSGEDCLTLNVQRPSTARKGSNLPVVYWIYGGGFEFGSTQMYDGTQFITKSITLKQDVIYVAVNYRLTGFGFLAGKELQEDGSTNLGLRDQRLGLQWVADNIREFGGDPDKVTVWGESAGSISAYDQALINGGDNTYKGKALFRGIMMDSGSAVPAQNVDHPKPQAVYDTVVKNSGCSGAADTLACLRGLDYTTFLNGVNSVPGIFSYRSVDLAYLPRPDPASSFFPKSPDVATSEGSFSRVPMIIGDQEDEGTLFSLQQSNISTTDQLVTYVNSYFPDADRQTISKLVANYPNNPSAGSPFHTGPLYNIYPQFKRLAAILGDLTFTLTRRSVLARIADKVPTWSYLNTYLQGTPVLGTFHASDILETYNAIPYPIPGNSVMTYYISFINSLDPNKIQGQLNWPKWTEKGRQLLEFKQLSNGYLKDNFREKSYQYLLSTMGRLRV